MRTFLRNWGFTPITFFQLVLITVNAQLIYAFWDLRNSIPKDFPVAMGVTDGQASYLYSMQGVAIIVGTIALGWVGDRFSIRTIMLLSSMGAGAISLFITISSPHLGLGGLLVCFFLLMWFTEVFFKPANFKAVRVSTSADHQGAAFGVFEFGRGLLGFLMASLWAALVLSGATPKTLMWTASIIVIVAGLAVFFVVPKDAGLEDEHRVDSTLEAIKGVGRVAKIPAVWLTGVNVFCIYGIFVAAGTYFARFMQAAYALGASAAAVFAAVVIGLRMLPLLSSILVEKVFKSSLHFMRLLEGALTVVLVAIGIIFFSNQPTVTQYAPGHVPTGLISNSTFYLLTGLMLLASALTFMVRAVYYAPIGEFKVPEKESSAAMSFAITVGYVPALLAPIVFGGLISPAIKNQAGEIVTEVLTPTTTLGAAFIGMAILTAIAAIVSHVLVRMKARQESREDVEA